MKNRIIYLLLLILFTIFNCIFLFVNLKEKNKKDEISETVSSHFEKKPWETVSLPEAIITNHELFDFCKQTLLPVVRGIGLTPSKNLVNIIISKGEGGNYRIDAWPSCAGSVYNEELPEGYIEAFCVIDDYPIKVEAPADCSLIEIKKNEVSFTHDENEYFLTSDYPEWFFHTEGNSLIFDEVRFVLPDEEYEGKKINESTGRLE